MSKLSFLHLSSMYFFTDILGTNSMDILLSWRLRDRVNSEFSSNTTKWGNIVCIINGRMKLFSNTTVVLGACTEWDKVTVTVSEFTGHLRALCIVILQDRHLLFATADWWGLCCGTSVLTSTMLESFIHNKIGLNWLLPMFCVHIFPNPLQPTRVFSLPCLVPLCPLSIFLLLPLTFHSPHICLLSEDRPLCGSPPHVQSDQYKGQGPWTGTPPLTKREGLKAEEPQRWMQVRVRACW